MLEPDVQPHAATFPLQRTCRRRGGRERFRSSCSRRPPVGECFRICPMLRVLHRRGPMPAKFVQAHNGIPDRPDWCSAPFSTRSRPKTDYRFADKRGQAGGRRHAIMDRSPAPQASARSPGPARPAPGKTGQAQGESAHRWAGYAKLAYLPEGLHLDRIIPTQRCRYFSTLALRSFPSRCPRPV